MAKIPLNFQLPNIIYLPWAATVFCRLCLPGNSFSSQIGYIEAQNLGLGIGARAKFPGGHPDVEHIEELK